MDAQTDSGTTTQPHAQAARRHILKSIGIGLLFWYLLAKPLVVQALAIPGPWGPEVVAHLPNGWIAIVRVRRVGRESDDQLILVDPHGRRTFWMINNIHALNLLYAGIRFDGPGDGRLVVVKHSWFVADEVVATFDFATGTFTPENLGPPWANKDFGQLIAEGSTCYWWEPINPL